MFQHLEFPHTSSSAKASAVVSLEKPPIVSEPSLCQPNVPTSSPMHAHDRPIPTVTGLQNFKSTFPVTIPDLSKISATMDRSRALAAQSARSSPDHEEARHAY